MRETGARLIHWHRTPIDTCNRKGTGIDRRVEYRDNGEVIQHTGIARDIKNVTCIVCRLYWKLHQDIEKLGHGG